MTLTRDFRVTISSRSTRGSEFLLAMLKQIRELMIEGKIEIAAGVLETCIIGVEFDPLVSDKKQC
jgi:hypothetical protein